MSEVCPYCDKEFVSTHKDRIAELEQALRECQYDKSISRNTELEAEVERLQGALRQIRNSLGAYRRYEVSVYLEDADNVAKLALKGGSDD